MTLLVKPEGFMSRPKLMYSRGMPVAQKREGSGYETICQYQLNGMTKNVQLEKKGRN